METVFRTFRRVKMLVFISMDWNTKKDWGYLNVKRYSRESFWYIIGINKTSFLVYLAINAHVTTCTVLLIYHVDLFIRLLPCALWLARKSDQDLSGSTSSHISGYNVSAAEGISLRFTTTTRTVMAGNVKQNAMEDIELILERVSISSISKKHSLSITNVWYDWLIPSFHRVNGVSKVLKSTSL